ncbi:MAG: hypothetical protein HKN21_02375 [Candidatus Eisenbacteria bacterium]|uniref:PqqD family peptide modification chaperone n=1 Tax=Eiseniibacteriota bacterium TaxID=2212470 RepID=A0A7Y2H126_UNCEI|nr:hypothetical protein [Candidatus Eisenbacteria bacterium]
MNANMIVPEPVSGLEFSTHADPAGSFRVFAPPDRYFVIPSMVRDLLQLIDGKRTLEEISRLHGGQGHPAIDADSLHRLLRQNFSDLVIVEGSRPTERAAKSPMWFRVPVLSASAANRVGSAFSKLYQSSFLAVTSLLLLLLHLGFVFLKLPTLPSFTDPRLWVIPILVYTVSTLWHEVGHISALRAYGQSPGAVGFGFYRMFPVMYSDVSRSWLLSQKQRVIVDLGGIYFHLIFAAACVVGYAFTQEIVWAQSAVLIYAGVLANLNPFLRLDGYWVASDLLDRSDLRKNSRHVLRAAVKGGQDSGESKWVRLYAWLSLGYFAWLAWWVGSRFIPRALAGVQELWGKLSTGSAGEGWLGHPVVLAGMILLLAFAMIGAVTLFVAGLRMVWFTFSPQSKPESQASAPEKG